MVSATNNAQSDFTEADYDTTRLATLVSHLDSAETGEFLDALVAVDGPAWWGRFASTLIVNVDTAQALSSLSARRVLVI